MAKISSGGRVLCVWGVLALLAAACGANAEGFVGRQGTQFVLDGAPFLFNGFNSYWMMHVASEPGERDKVTEVLREASAAGLTVCRTWAFSDGGDRALQVSPGVYDEQVFQGLDFVVSEAQRYGIRLILTLVNNFNDFGGRAQYVEWARDAGAPVNAEDEFYINPVVKGYYKNHVQKVLTRINSITKLAYKDDPTIMSWELINEPRCHSDFSGKIVHDWVQEMAPYLKSLDSKHLLAIGMEGFYGDSMPEKKEYNPGYTVGTDYISSNLINEIDFATIHAYPDIWLSSQNEISQTAFAQRWMWSHWDDATKILKKPLVFAEFGKSKKDPGYSENERDVFINTIYADIYNLAKSGTGSLGGGLVWQIVAEGMDSFYDGYEIVLPQNPSTNAVLMKQSSAMSVLARTMSRPAVAAQAHRPRDNGAADQEREAGEDAKGRLVHGRKHGRGHAKHRGHVGGQRGHPAHP